MLFTSIIKVMVMGAASTVGSMVAKKGIEVAVDPYERAKMKQKIHKIKDKFRKETEVA